MELYLDAETFGIWHLNKNIAKELNCMCYGMLCYLATLKSRCEKHVWVHLKQALASILLFVLIDFAEKETELLGVLDCKSTQVTSINNYKYELLCLKQVRHLKTKDFI